MNKRSQLIGTLSLFCISLVNSSAQSLAADDFTENWQGLFAGVHGGWDRAELNGRTESILVNDNTNSESSNWSMGGQLGYNYQMGHWVIGLEVSGSLGDHDRSGICFANSPDTDVSFGGGGGITNITTSYRCKSAVNWTARSLLRAGYASNQGRLLSYLVGGVAISDVELDYNYHFSETRRGLGALFDFQVAA